MKHPQKPKQEVKQSPAQHSFQSMDGLLGLEEGEQCEEVALSQIVPFERHPFQVKQDDKMKETIESIAEHGVLTPILLRPKGKRQFEVVSGHRRVEACRSLGIETIPALIREMDDDLAVIVMVDSNIQREELLPSERAFAYQMKYEAMKQQGTRSDLNKKSKLDSFQQMGKDSGESGRQIQRYIRLTYLNPDLLASVDGKKLPFLTAVELSYLSLKEQGILWSVMEELQLKPSLEQSILLKELSQTGELNEETASLILAQMKMKETSFSMKKDIASYFPKGTSQKEMEEQILYLLEKWAKKRKKEEEKRRKKES